MMDNKHVFGTLYSSTESDSVGTPDQQGAHQIEQYVRAEARRVGADRDTALDGLLGIVSDETGKLGKEIKETLSHEDAAQFIPSGDAEPPSEVYLAPADIQRRYASSLTVDTVTKRLDRWRKKHFDGWHEVKDRRANEARYVYAWGAVRHLFVASNERPTE